MDYAFLVYKLEPNPDEPTASRTTKPNVTVPTAYDVTTGIVMAAVVEAKGVNDYAVHELLRFIL